MYARFNGCYSRYCQQTACVFVQCMRNLQLLFALKQRAHVDACAVVSLGVPEPVEVIEARTAGPQSAIVSWLPPHDAGSDLLNYVVQLQKWPRLRCALLCGMVFIAICTVVQSGCSIAVYMCLRQLIFHYFPIVESYRLCLAGFRIVSRFRHALNSFGVSLCL